jgi:hypothetical protein
MKKKILFLVIFKATISFGQQKAIDSLSQLLKNYSAADTVMLDLLNELSYAYYGVEPEKGLQAADKAIVLAKNINNKTKLARAYNYKGI